MRFMFIVVPLRFPVTSYLNEQGLEVPGTLCASIPTGIPRPASIHRRLVLTGAGLSIQVVAPRTRQNGGSCRRLMCKPR